MMQNSLAIIQKKKSLINIIIDICLIIITVIAVVILSMCIIIIVKKIISPSKVPDVFGIKPFIVLTGSMEPTINTGDMAIIKIVNPENLKVGDIIAFRNTEEDVITLHRIVQIEKEDNTFCFKTKGDNNNFEDKQIVKKENLEGIYINRIKGLGKIAMFIRTPMGVICSVLFIVIIFLLWQIVKIKQTERLLLRRIITYRETIKDLERRSKN